MNTPIPPDRKQPVAIPPEGPGPNVVSLLQGLHVDPFVQAALLRVYQEAPERLDPVTRLRIVAAAAQDEHNTHNHSPE